MVSMMETETKALRKLQDLGLVVVEEGNPRD